MLLPPTRVQSGQHFQEALLDCPKLPPKEPRSLNVAVSPPQHCRHWGPDCSVVGLSWSEQQLWPPTFRCCLLSLPQNVSTKMSSDIAGVPWALRTTDAEGQTGTCYDRSHPLTTRPTIPSSFWLGLDQACDQHQASVSLICALARPHWPCPVAKWRHGVCALSLARGRAGRGLGRYLQWAGG